MKSIRFLIVASVLCLIGPAALAEIRYVDHNDPSDGSTVTACKAYGSLKQTCRQCKWIFEEDGVTLKSVNCGYTFNNAACKCTVGTFACTAQGSCTYV